jgi:hypothetical protein
MSTEKTDGQEDTETVELSPEQVLEADEYAHNRAVREVQDARAEVRDAIRDMKIKGDGRSIPAPDMTKVANLTAVYVYEVMPLVRKGDVPDEMLELQEGHPWDNLQQFATAMGMKDDAERPCNTAECMVVYDRCNRIADYLGIGVSLDKTGDGLEL